MNRLLLKECLDELRSDDLEELTEGNKERWSKKRKEKWRLKRQRQTAISGVQNRPRCMSQSGTPTESGSNAGQQTRVKAPHYTPEQEAKATAFLQSLAQIIGEEMDNVDHTAYLHPTINGFLSHFRLADHRGDASQFARRNEWERCFGIVVKMNEKRFVPNDETDYEEEVFFPDKLTDEKMKAISDGVANYIQTGVYNGPKGDESNPQEPLHPNPVNQSVPWQQPQTPAMSPTEPGVQEAFFNRFSNLDYLYRILDEGKDRLIDRLPSLDDAQKTQMKRFFAKRPSLESKFDWNRPDTITWDAFQSIANGYEEPIDPDTIPEFSDKRDEGAGIFSYQVQDDKNGQLAVRRIIDTHWGKDANPWCLTSRGEYQWETTPEYREWLQTQDLGWRGLEYLAAHGTLDEDDDRMFKGKYKRETGKSAEVHDDGLSTARRLWLHYSSLPKRIAFRNGKLLAFMATEDAKKFGELWWDRNNKDHPSVHDCVISTPPQESALS